MKNIFEQELYSKRFELSLNKKNIIWKVLCKNFFQKFIDNDDIVLDIPTGYGEFINNISCKKKYAIDINPESKNHVDADVIFFQCSSTKIILKANSIDKIFVSNFFEHLERKDILKTIQEFYRILKPGGKVLVLQPNIRFCAKDYWMFLDHITPIDDRALKEAFALYSFQEIFKIERFLPYTTKSRFPKNMIFIRLYLSVPFLWKFFGKQSFLIFKK